MSKDFISDASRIRDLQTLTGFHAPTLYDLAVDHMPTEAVDPDGSLFNRYFDFLQECYVLKNEWRDMDLEEVERFREFIRKEAPRYDYPIQHLMIIPPGK